MYWQAYHRGMRSVGDHRNILSSQTIRSGLAWCVRNSCTRAPGSRRISVASHECSDLFFSATGFLVNAFRVVDGTTVPPAESGEDFVL